MKGKEKLTETLAFRVTDATYDLLKSIADKDRRRMSDVAQAILERGIAAYKRDDQLFEPEEAQMQLDISARKRRVG